MSHRPVIDSLVPRTGWAGTAYPIRVIIEGRNFAAEANSVTFGAITVGNLSSDRQGTRITFTVPKETPSTGEVPPMVLQPGEYEVTVITAAGASDPVVFILTRPGA